MLPFKRTLPVFYLSITICLSFFSYAFALNCTDQELAKPEDPYWMEVIRRRGSAPYSANPNSYKVYRNVKDYGAKGDGKTDDTDAIQRAIMDGSRCGAGCQASTVTPAVVYFPSGTYLISRPIEVYYYTSMVGNPKSLPTLLASSAFKGVLGVLDADPYFSNGANWYINQNNFFRSIRNFVIDITQVPASSPMNGIHWQVSQATSLTNVRFEMSREEGNNHRGVFIENGSGGLMSDLYLRGGRYGLNVGNQQFTVRNVTLDKIQTGIYQIWNWAWTYQDVKIVDCKVGINMTSTSTGSILLSDVDVRNTPTFMATTGPNTSNMTVILDNITFQNVDTGLISGTDTVLLTGGKNKAIKRWIQGNAYQGSSTKYNYSRDLFKAARRSPKLLDSNGKYLSKRRPEYENYTPDQFVSIKAQGAKGDGVHDDTEVIQKTLYENGGCKIVYFDAGTYYVTNTITIPQGSIVVGEVWSTIIGGGPNFADPNNPRAVVEVGREGDRKPVQMSNLVLSARSGSAGAIVLRWNIGEPTRQSDMSGMWDVHVRLGGFVGSGVQVNNCLATSIGKSSNDCVAAFMGIHLTKNAAVYMEGGWVWAADHDLDDPQQRQINVFAGRGVFVESCNGPVWIVGGSSEHFAIYQYNLVGAKNVYLGLPYWQPNPASPTPFSTSFNDPALTCGPAAWALAITKSADVYAYGAGFYSFFQSYSQKCVADHACQDTLINVDKESEDVYLYSLATVGVAHMLGVDSKVAISENNNRNGFQSNVAAWTSDKCSV